MPQVETKTKFKETEIGLIPEEWEVKELGDIIEFNPSRSLKKGTICNFVTMADLNPFQRQIAKSSIKEFSGGSKFRNGDTLLARITPCLENGKTAFVDILKNNIVAGGSTEFMVLAPFDSKVIDNTFIYYLFTSKVIRDMAIKSMVGSSGRQRVQEDMLAGYKISLPPLCEQKSIAEVLSSLDEKIELNRRMNKTLEEMGKALFKRWFVDFEFPNEDGKPYKSSGGAMVDSELGEIPEGWEVKPLSSLATFLNGLPLQKYRPKGNEFLPVIKIRELKSGISDSTDKADIRIPDEYKISNGDILFSWSGSLELTVWTHGYGALNQHLFKVTSIAYPQWLLYYYIDTHMNDFRSIAANKATTMGHIQRTHLDQALCTIPLKEILKVFSNTIKPIFSDSINLKVEIEKLKVIRESLLPKLISGKIRVKN